MPVREFLMAAVWLALLGAPGGPGEAPAKSRLPQTNRAAALDPQTVASRADAWLRAYELAGDFSGVVLLAEGDRVLFEKAYGYADPQVRSPNRLETRFRVASISKTFTAAAIEQLSSEGKLGYADPLSRYVPGIPNGESITIEELLQEQSGVGLLDFEDVFRDCLSRDDVLRRLSLIEPLFEPGEKSASSKEGYFLLSAAIERASQVPYDDFLRKSIFAPLQMANTGTACRELPAGRNAFGSVATATEARLRPLAFNQSALAGADSIYSSAEDLLRWLRAVDSNPAFSAQRLRYPYGWGKRRYRLRDLIEQSGQLAGFFSHVTVYPREHVYGVVLANIQSGFSSRIAADLDAVLFGGTVSLPPSVKPITIGERSMRQYIGTYHAKPSAYSQTVAIREGQLMLHWGADPFWREMAMIDGDTFFVRADYATVRFERGPEGAVHRMVSSSSGGPGLSFEKDEILRDNAPAPSGNP